MSFAKPSFIAVALLGAENAACALAVTSQTVTYGTPDGPFGAGAVTGFDTTPFQMTAIETAVGVLLFADRTPLGWLPSDMVDAPSIDWQTVATYPGLRSPETSPVPMGLDVVAPLTAPAPRPDFASVVAAMEKSSGADLSHLLEPSGVRCDPDADETTRIAGPGTVEPFAVLLEDTADEAYSNLFIGDGAEALRRILDADPGSGGAWDDVLFAVTAKMGAVNVEDLTQGGWWNDQVAEVIADQNIPADRVFRGAYS